MGGWWRVEGRRTRWKDDEEGVLRWAGWLAGGEVRW